MIYFWTSMRSAIPWSCATALVETLFREFNQTAFNSGQIRGARSTCTLLFHRILTVLYDVKLHTTAISPEAAILQRRWTGRYPAPSPFHSWRAPSGRLPDYTISCSKKLSTLRPTPIFSRQKLAAAQNLLQNTTLPVQEIARQLGYDDAHYFSNVFKAQFGVSPRAYRQ